MTTPVHDIVSIADAPDPAGLHWLGGRPGHALETRQCFAVRQDGHSRWEVAIQWRWRTRFEAQCVWPEAHAALFGGGDEVYALDLDAGALRYHTQVGGYFGGFAIAPDRSDLFVLGCSDVIALNCALQRIWIAENIAVDGVLLHEVKDGRLHLSAEMDPPGGWERVEIDRRTGEELRREIDPAVVR